MAYKEADKRLFISLPPQVPETISKLNLPGNMTQRIVWLIYEGIAAHPELQRQLAEKFPYSAPPKTSEKNPATSTAQDD